MPLIVPHRCGTYYVVDSRNSTLVLLVASGVAWLLCLGSRVKKVARAGVRWPL